MKQEKIIGITFAALGAALIVLCGILYLKADRTAPVIEFQSVDTVYREGMDETEILKGARAYDSVEGDVSDRIVIEKIIEAPESGQAVIFYAVSDSSGNVAKASRVFEAVYDMAEKETGQAAEGFMEAGITAELGSLQKDGAGEKNEPGQDGSDKEAGGLGRESNQGEQDTAGQENGAGREEDEPSPSPEASASPVPVREPSPKPAPTREPSPEPEPAPPRQADSVQDASAPVLTLKVSEVRVKAGQGPAWVDIIGTLKDDKDDYAVLFGNLSVGRYDRDKPGTYQVDVSTEDSDGNKSQAVPVTIIVE